MSRSNFRQPALLAALSLAGLAMAQPALAASGAYCGTGVSSRPWLEKAEVRARVINAGIDVRQVAAANGCYRVRAMSDDGRLMTLDVDPANGEILRGTIRD